MAGEEQLRRLSADIGRAARTTGARAQLVVRKTALDIERTAKNMVPVDTGNLKGSIGHSDMRRVGRSGNLSVEIGPSANYGLFVEQGTTTQGPQPYMAPAADAHEGPFMQAMQQLGLEGLDG